MKLKVLDANMRSPFQRFEFKVGKWYHCEDFDMSNVQCSNGFYVTGVEGLTYAYRNGKRVFEAEVKGKNKVFGIYKQRHEYIKLVRELDIDEIKELAKAEELKCGYKLCEALFPFNPLTDGNPRNRVTKRDIDNLKKCISVKDSVYDSVRESVSASVRESVWGPVWESVSVSVWDSVWESVSVSVWAYMGSFFPNIKKWKYIDHKEGEYPFQYLVDLWYRGFVPSYVGKKWRLHQGKDAKIVYELKEE